jgi:cysteine desulfurase family protein (TIGR01976 family)
MLTIDDIRSAFPALERKHNNFPVAYFDGPGGTQVPKSVGDAMLDYLYRHNANTHWNYPTSAETDEALEQARVTCAKFLHSSPNEIAFGANMTTLTFHLSRALGTRFRGGDEIIVTELDHHANIAPWHRLAIEKDLRVRTVPLIPETGQLDWSEFEHLLTARTRLIALGAASNALGTINDVTRAVKLARSAGVLVFIDAVHYAPHALIDVKAWDCDFLSMSAYKFYGPHVGLLYGKSELLQLLDFPKLIPAPDEAPENVETGTQNHEGIVGMAAAIDYLASLGEGEDKRTRLGNAFAGLHGHSAKLTRKLWQGLTEIEGVRLYGPNLDEPRTPTVAFTVDGVSSSEVAGRLANRGLFLSHGNFYAATVTERLGLGEEGLVRAGCACYTTEEEIERLIEGVRELSAQR